MSIGVSLYTCDIFYLLIHEK